LKVVESKYESDNVDQIKSYLYDKVLNVTDPILDDLWEYWIQKYHRKEWCSTSYIDYRWNGDYEESFIKYEYISKFIDWLETVDVDDVSKLLQEE
jgi:hypothetical protein